MTPFLVELNPYKEIGYVFKVIYFSFQSDASRNSFSHFNHVCSIFFSKMSKDKIDIIEAEPSTQVDESIVKQVWELLDSEGRNDMANTIKTLMDHYEKTFGKVI